MQFRGTYYVERLEDEERSEVTYIIARHWCGRNERDSTEDSGRDEEKR